VLLPADRVSMPSFVSSQILLVWMKLLFDHSSFGEKFNACFTDLLVGGSLLCKAGTGLQVWAEQVQGNNLGCRQTGVCVEFSIIFLKYRKAPYMLFLGRTTKAR